MPKVSIITTTYKHQDFIADTIESVLSQAFTEWELLIGDDSPDNKTWNIIQEYVNKYPDKIKAWHHNPNKGIVDNMNFLLKKVSKESEYIAFLEGDDMYTPDNLKEKIKIFEYYTDVKLVYSDSQLINKKNNIINKKSIIKINNGKNEFSLINFLKLGNPIQSFGTVMIKKYELYKYVPLINLDKNNKMFGPLDYSLWVNIIPNNTIYYLNKKLFLYRIHDNNFIKNISIMNNQIELIYKNIIKNNPNKNIIKICNYFIKKNRAISSFFEGSRIDTIKYIIESCYYNQTKDIIERLGILFLSFMPTFIKNYFINKFKK